MIRAQSRQLSFVSIVFKVTKEFEKLVHLLQGMTGFAGWLASGLAEWRVGVVFVVI